MKKIDIFFLGSEMINIIAVLLTLTLSKYGLLSKQIILLTNYFILMIKWTNQIVNTLIYAIRPVDNDHQSIQR